MSIREKAFKGFLWRFLERSGAQAVSLVLTIVLARLLEPEAYGVIALVTVFTNILQTFIDSGLGVALVQKKDADTLDFSTVFYFNILMCISLYLVLYGTASFIAKFYAKPELVPIIRVLGVTLLVSGMRSVQQAFLSIKLLFKKLFYATLVGTIGAACIGIVMAYRGFGVWALVVQHLFNSIVSTGILWFTVKWRPKKEFSCQRLKSLFSFGWKLLISKLFDRLCNEVRVLIIGKKYTASDLAYYNRGEQYPNMLVLNIDTATDSVLLPVLSQHQDNIAVVKSMTRRAIQVSAFLIIPMMVWFSVCAPTLVHFVLGEKWLPCVPYIQLFCIAYAFWPMHTANLNAIKALGRSDIFLKLDIVKRILNITTILLTMRIGVYAMAIGVTVNSILSQLINAYPNKRLLDYHLWNQMMDILPALLLSIAMGGGVYLIHFCGMADMPTLFLQGVTGFVIYIGLSYIFKFSSFEYLTQTLLRLRCEDVRSRNEF